MGREAGTAGASTKELLLRAGERLFAEQGIHRVPLREINALAGQRNPSALHYHFGSRDGLVEAILSAHQASMDVQLRPRLDELAVGAIPPTVRQVVEVVVGQLTEQSATQSGRDFLRILPQVVDAVSAGVRHGNGLRSAAQPARVLALLEGGLGRYPTAVRRERLVTYVWLLTSLFAERAVVLESGSTPALDDAQFAAHAVDVVTAVIAAPSSVTGLAD